MMDVFIQDMYWHKDKISEYGSRSVKREVLAMLENKREELDKTIIEGGSFPTELIQELQESLSETDNLLEKASKI